MKLKLWMIVAALIITSVVWGAELTVIRRTESSTFKRMSSLEGFYVPQGAKTQSVIMFEPSGKGTEKVTFETYSGGISADRSVEVRDTGIFFGGALVGAPTDITGKLDITTFNSYTSIHSGATGGASSLSELSDWPADVSATEVGYLNGVTSNIQTQISAVSAGSLPQFANYTGADGTSWIDTGSAPPSLVTRIADKLYEVVMTLKATLIAVLGWASESYDFGSVTEGVFTIYSTALNNTGSYATQSLAFSNLSSSVFATYSTPTSIASGGHAHIKYRFKAPVGAHTGHLHATSTGIADAVLTLTGTGIAAGGTISIASYSYVENTTIANIIIDKPSGLTEGDLMIATITSDWSEASGLTSAGWTEIQNITVSSSSTYMFYKIATGTDASGGVTNYTFVSVQGDSASVSAGKAGIIARLTKTNGTWAISDSSEVSATAATSLGTVAVTGVSDSLLMIGFGSDDTTAITAPTDMTELHQVSISSMECGLYYQSVGAGDVEKTFSSLSSGDHAAIAVIVSTQ